MKTTGRVILLVATTCALASRADAGAWTPEVGRGFVRERVILTSADSYWDSAGAWQPGDWMFASTDYRSTRILHTSEHGIQPGLSFLLELGYRDIEAKRDGSEPNERTQGFADLRVGLKRRILSGRPVVSVLGLLEIPTGYDKVRNPSPTEFYQIGPGETNLELRLLAGTTANLGPVAGWLNAEGGYRLRGGEYMNDLTYLSSAGIRPFRFVELRGQVEGVESLLQEGDPIPAGLPYNSASYTSAGGGAAFFVRRNFAVEIFYTQDLRGSNAFKGRTIAVSFEYRN